MANDRNVLVYMNAFCVYVWHTQNTCECFVLVVGVPLRISLDAAAANCCSRCTKSGVALSGVRERAKVSASKAIERVTILLSPSRFGGRCIFAPRLHNSPLPKFYFWLVPAISISYIICSHMNI